MTDDELRKKIIEVLERKYGHTHRFDPKDRAEKPCTTVTIGFDGRHGARSLSFGEVADAAVEAFESWGDDVK